MEIHSKTNGGSVVGLEKVLKKEVYKYGVIEIEKKFNNFFSISKI